MASISEKLPILVNEALKAKETERLGVLRMLMSALSYEKISLQHVLTAEEELAVIRKEAKKRRDSIDAYTKANRLDKAMVEEAELKILSEFLPAEMDDAQIEAIVSQGVSELGITGMADMGKIMGYVMSKVGGQASGDRVSLLVRKVLTAK